MKHTLSVGDVVTLNFKSINNYGYYRQGVTGETKLTISHIDHDPMIKGRMYIVYSEGEREDFISTTETAVHRVVNRAKKPKPRD